MSFHGLLNNVVIEAKPFSRCPDYGFEYQRPLMEYLDLNQSRYWRVLEKESCLTWIKIDGAMLHVRDGTLFRAHEEQTALTDLQVGRSADFKRVIQIA